VCVCVLGALQCNVVRLSIHVFIYSCVCVCVCVCVQKKKKSNGVKSKRVLKKHKAPEGEWDALFNRHQAPFTPFTSAARSQSVCVCV
jgi:hypothetical protein